MNSDISPVHFDLG